MILELRGGGEIVCEAALIARIEPDEIPYPVLASSPSADAALAPTPLLAGRPYSDLIDTIAAAEGIDARLIHAVVQVESGYQPRARSPKGAMGLMQLMPGTARDYGVRNAYDPRSNLEAGVRHLKGLLRHFDLSDALAAYNAGEAAVRRFGGIPPYRETQEYVARILRLLGAQRP